MNVDGVIQYTGLCLIIFVISFVFSAFRKMPNKKKRIYLFITLGILAFFTMFRDIYVGNDTLAYVSLFNKIGTTDNLYQYIVSSNIEPGYIIYNKILYLLSNNYCILLIVTGIVFYLSIYRFLYKWSKAPGLIVFLMVSMMHFDFFISAMRQTIAVAILLYGFDFVMKRKPIKFLIVIALASSFHYSSLFFIIAYIIAIIVDRPKYNKFDFFKYLVMISVACFLLFDEIFNIIISVFPKYSYYVGTNFVDGEPRMAIILKIFVYLLLLFSVYILANNKKMCNSKVLKIVEAYSVVNILTFYISLNATVFTRLCDIYFIYPLLFYSESLANYRCEKLKVIVGMEIFTILLFYMYGFVIVLLKTPQWYSTYPYLLCF